jgi:zinc protease
LDRIMIKFRTAKEFQDQGLLNRAMNLCNYELLGDPDGVNSESEKYHQITTNDILRCAKNTLTKSNCSILNVKADKNAK